MSSLRPNTETKLSPLVSMSSIAVANWPLENSGSADI